MSNLQKYNNPEFLPAIGLIVTAAVASAMAVAFYFDSTNQYCDKRTNPCTFVTVRLGEEVDNPSLIQYPQKSTGAGLFKLLLSLGGTGAALAGWAGANKAIREQESIDHERLCDTAVVYGGRQIEADKQLTIAAKAAQADVDAETVVYLDELVEWVGEQLDADEENEIFRQFAKLKLELADALHQKQIEEAKASTSLSAIAQSQIPATEDNLEHYLAVGDGALTKTTKLTQSTIILATPGAGKTTFLGVTFGRMKRKHGDNFKLSVIVMKPKDVAKFSSFTDNVACMKTDPSRCIKLIQEFYDSMTAHQSLESNPIVSRLFLDDFLTMWTFIDKVLKGRTLDMAGETVKLSDGVIAICNDAFFTGRESNDAIMVSSHSPNIEDLPFVNSKSGRVSGSLIFLARQDALNENGNFEIIQQNITSQHLISCEEKRAELKAIAPGLIDLSIYTGQPIILTSHGQTGGWEMGLVRSDIRDEYEELSSSFKVNSKPVESPIKSVKPEPSVEVKDQPLFTPQENKQMLNAIYESFLGKGRTRINRIPTGCRKVAELMKEKQVLGIHRTRNLHYLIDFLVSQGKAVKYTGEGEFVDGLDFRVDDEFEIVSAAL